MIDVACVGETLWDLRARGALEALDEVALLRARPGGAAVNVALAVTAAGLAANVCGPLGDDPLGRALSRRLRAAGVRPPKPAAAPLRTGVVLAGSDAVMSYRSARDEARALRACVPARSRARVVHLAGLLPGPDGARLARAVRRSAAGRLLSVDVNARPRLWRGQSAAPIWAAVTAADVVKCSREDLRALSVAPAELRRRMRASAVLLLTDGAASTQVLGPFGAARVQPVRRDQVDSVGAGDRFCAAVLVALLRAPPAAAGDRAFWMETVRFAHLAATRPPRKRDVPGRVSERSRAPRRA
jgi:sugar/nucleoside kinase (ribokinase family)